MRNPPSLSDCRSEKGEAVFQKAMEHWLEKALLEYLPAEVLCLVPAPLLPDSSRLYLPVPYLGRTGSDSAYKGIARFGVVTALFQEHKASLFLRIHQCYGGLEPVIVTIRKDGDPSDIDPEVSEVGKFCIVSVPCPPDDQPHSGDTLAGGFKPDGKVFRVEPSEFRLCPDAMREAALEHTGDGDHAIKRIIDEHIEEYSFYAPTLAPILHHAQVVMVLARSIHDKSWEKRRKFGAGGVTFLLEPDCKMTEDLAIRLCAIAQRVDGLLGSLHFASEDVARAKTAASALGILKHSVGNSLRTMMFIKTQVAPNLKILDRCLYGAVAYAQNESSVIREQGKAIPWSKLGYKGCSFDETLKSVIWKSYRNLSFSVEEIKDKAPDSRVLVMVEELARNLANGPNKEGHIAIKCDPKTGIGTISVKGSGTAEDLKSIQDRLMAIEPSFIAVSLRGLGTVIELSQSLKGPNSSAEYALGEEAIRRRAMGVAADFSNQDLQLHVWTQDEFDPYKNVERIFAMEFINLKLAIL